MSKCLVCGMLTQLDLFAPRYLPIPGQVRVTDAGQRVEVVRRELDGWRVEPLPREVWRCQWLVCEATLMGWEVAR